MSRCFSAFRCVCVGVSHYRNLTRVRVRISLYHGQLNDLLQLEVSKGQSSSILLNQSILLCSMRQDLVLICRLLSRRMLDLMQHLKQCFSAPCCLLNVMLQYQCTLRASQYVVDWLADWLLLLLHYCPVTVSCRYNVARSYHLISLLRSFTSTVLPCCIVLLYCSACTVRRCLNLVSIKSWFLLLQVTRACRAIFGVSREPMCILCGLI